MIWGARHQSFNIRVFVTIVHNSVVERLVRCTNSIHCSLVDGIATKKMQIHHLLAQKEGKSSLTLQSWSKVIGTPSLSCHLSPPPPQKKKNSHTNQRTLHVVLLAFVCMIIRPNINRFFKFSFSNLLVANCPNFSS